MRTLSINNHREFIIILILKKNFLKEISLLKILLQLQTSNLMDHIRMSIRLFINPPMNSFLNFQNSHIKVSAINYLTIKPIEMKIVRKFFLKILGFLTILFILKVRELSLQEVLFWTSRLKIFIKMTHFILPLR